MIIALLILLLIFIGVVVSDTRRMTKEREETLKRFRDAQEEYELRCMRDQARKTKLRAIK